MKNFFLFIFDIFKIVFLALLVVIPVRYFLFQPFFVIGQSMEPNFKNGDYLVVDEISYRFADPNRGDVIVFKFPGDPKQRYIKRIIGIPGETVKIEEGKITISNQEKSWVLDESNYLPSSLTTSSNEEISLGNDEYFVLGDNRPFSSDSRRWGLLPRENIIGRVFLRALPLGAFAKIDAPSY